MKALSIRQPWAWMIMNLGKDIENRNWSTGLRGRILIHAAKGMTRDEYDEAIEVARTARAGVPADLRIRPPGFETVARGGIIGSVEIVDCVSTSTSPWFFGRYGFVLRNPQPMAFLPCRGALGFFEVPEGTCTA
jgi:hypothetical protein